MKIPLFPLDVVLFPGAALPLHIFEERYKEMVGVCLAGSSAFGVARAQRDGLAVIGCTAEIVRVLHKYPDGRMDILCEGQRRFEIESLDNSRSFLQAEVDFFDDNGAVASRELREECAALHWEATELLGVEPAGRVSLDGPISFQLGADVPSDLGFKQELLGMRSDEERMERLLAFYKAMLPKLRLGVRAAKTAARNGQVM